MALFHNISLSKRLFYAIAGTSLLVLILAVIILAPIELQKFKNNRLFQGHVIMDAYTAQFVQMVSLNTAEQAVDMSLQLSGFTDLLSLFIEDMDGQRIFTYTSEQHNTSNELFKLSPFDIDESLSYQNKRYGRVYMVISPKGYEEALFLYLSIGSSLVFGLFCLAVLIARWQELRISKPIAMLAEEMGQSGVHYDHKLNIESNQSPEIKELYEGFNQFIKTIDKAQSALLEQKQALDVSAIVSISDLDGTITYANELFYKSTGFQQDEVIGKKHQILKSGYHDDTFFDDLWKTIKAGNVWRGVICNRHKDGDLLWHNTTIVPFFSEAKLYQFLAIRFDITEQKILEKVLITTREKAERANQAKSDFLSSMSHELRTPLNAILGFAQLLESDEMNPLSEEQQDNVSIILSSGQHLLRLINDVLELSAIEAGKIILYFENVRLKDAVDDSVSMLIPLAHKANIAIHVLSDLTYIVNVDYTKLKQIIINLVTNAIKYNQQGGSVSIDWERTVNNTVRISVIDTGIGISEADQHKVFSAFSRLGKETSTVEGNGIGLAVTKNLVELMAGEIGFVSVENKGSTFWFELPIVETSTEIDSI